MTDHLHVLEQALSDVGYWRWWSERLPDTFQVEFGGAQLHFPPASPAFAPNDVVALRFHEPTLVAFLAAGDATDLAPDWRLALHEDRIDPFGVSHDLFTFGSPDVLAKVLDGCSAELRVGTDLHEPGQPGDVLLAFRAGDVGMVIRARRMTVIAVPGELGAAQVVAASGDWWAYWRTYWERRDTDEPMPRDYACEVTIPLKA